MVVSMLVLTFLFPVLQSDAYQKIFAPLPFATSEAAVESLPFGLVSKENLVVYYASKLEDVSMNEYIQGLWKDDQAKLRAFCYMMYLAMSIPCVMTLGAIRSEFGRKILMLSLGFMLVVPYVLSFVAFYLIVLMQNIVF